MKRYGASTTVWKHFSEVLDLTPSLLPTVCHPDAKVKPGSALEKIGPGKVPSLYNSQQLVVGIGDWVTKKVTARDISFWQKIPDYGICIRCDQVRGFDIDVEDMAVADDIKEIFYKHCGWSPSRYRTGTGKQLIPFYMFGQFGKRRMKLRDGLGLVEFLGNGQQFMAYGRHMKSGKPYLWDDKDGLPQGFVEVTEEQFEAVWAEVMEKYGSEDAEQEYKERARGKDLGFTDDIADELEGLGVVLSYGTNGSLNIECPWKGSHSKESGDSETVYMPAGGRGHERGHFKCQHASCLDKTDGDFLDAFFPHGLSNISNDFENLPALPVSAVPRFNIGKLERSKQDEDKFAATIGNVVEVLRHPSAALVWFGYDQFRDEIVYREVTVTVTADEITYGPYTPMRDTRMTELRLWMTNKTNSFMPIHPPELKAGMELVAWENRFDSLTEWIRSLKWDGVSRIETFNHTYMKTADTPMTRMMSFYMFVMLAARAVQPGCKADMAPVYQGEQGQRKSSAIAALAPHPEMFVTLLADDTNADIARKMRGAVIVEMEEMAINSRRGVEDIKSLIGRSKETWTPKYKEYVIHFLRRCGLIGSTNPLFFLNDETGARRFGPMSILPGEVCDVEGILEIMPQLWAEALVLFERDGLWKYWQQAEALSRKVHQNFTVQDDWHPAIERFLEQPVGQTDDFADPEENGPTPLERGWVTTEEILIGAIGLELERHERKASVRVSKTMQSLGWRNGFAPRKEFNGKQVRAWIK